MGKQWKQWETLFGGGVPKSLQMVTAAMKLKDACSLEEKLMTNLDSIWQSRDITLPTKVHIAKSVVFPVVMYYCESWTKKKDECWRHQPSIFIGRTDAEAEAPILWPPDVKNQLIGKDSDAGKDWKQEEKGTTEDDMVGWHGQLNRHEFEKTPGDGKGQGSLEC